MRPALIAPLVGGLLLVPASCSFEFRPDTAFPGTYELSKDCNLDVDEEGATASCTSDGKEVTVTISEDKVTFEKIALTEVEESTECWIKRTCTETYTGEAERKKGKGDPYDGRFGTIKGEWEGKLTLKTECDKGEPASGAPDWCDKSIGDVVYTFTAKVAGSEARIIWKADTGAAGDFKALETKNGVRVAETFYERIEQEAAE
jgi:hypothetical protein